MKDLRVGIGFDAHAFSDDAALVERRGGRVRVVEGDRRLLKVTTQADLDFVESLLSAAT